METEVLEIEKVTIRSNFFHQGMISAGYGSEEFDNPYPARTYEAKEWQLGLEEVQESQFYKTGVFFI